MREDGHPILTLAWTFGVMSLFAVGGANSAIPEMHRVAVDVHHWLTDKQFADVFAIAQLSPGPNVLIVTLIGYAVAGIGGALVATLAMCVPTAVLAFFVSRFLRRSSHSRWPAIVQAALVPLSIGLMGASGFWRWPRTGAGPPVGDRGRGIVGIKHPAQSALATGGRGISGVFRSTRLGNQRRPPCRRPAAWSLFGV
jgi:chromate transporter